MPGWRFAWYNKHDEGDVVEISFTVPNAREPGDQTQRVWTFVPPVSTEEEFYEWLRWRLRRIAIHEVNEFFLVDGQRVNDPHRPMEEQV